MAVPELELIEQRIDVLVPRGDERLGVLRTLAPLAPFQAETLRFIDAFSKAIMTGSTFRTYPEMIAFGHWIRRRQILDVQERFERQHADEILVARGVAFHIAPSNVDTIFLYSFVLALLAGNANIVRVSRKRSVQVEAILATLARLLDDPAHSAIRARLRIVTYDHDQEITTALSALADTRIIWGGDETVAAIRAVALPPTARDIAFPNKWSISVFGARALIEADQAKLADTAKRYVNDTYWFGQMACSSPRLMIWIGSPADGDIAAARFWPAIEHALDGVQTDIATIDMVNKRVAADVLAIDRQAVIRAGKSNLLNVVRLPDLVSLPVDDHCGAGLFYEACAPSLDPIPGLLGRKLQTVVSFGLDQAAWRTALTAAPPRGIDRIVPVGEALNFSPVWDGMDLLREYSRQISLDI